MKPFIVNMPQKIIFGNQSYLKIGVIAKGYGAKALVLHDSYVTDNPMKAEMLFAQLSENKIAFTLEAFFGETTRDKLDDLKEYYLHESFDMIIAFGSEDLINTAKVLRKELYDKNTQENARDTDSTDIKRKTYPLITLPARVFSPNNVTAKAYIIDYEATNYYLPLQDDALLPDMVIIDPDFCFQLPQKNLYLFAQTLLAELIETYVAADSSAFSDLMAQGGMDYLADCLKVLIEGKRIPDFFSERLCYASLMIGMASAHSKRGVIRGLMEQIKSKYAADRREITGALLYNSTLINMQRVEFYERFTETALKYAYLGSVFSGMEFNCDKKEILMRALAEYLSKLKIKAAPLKLSDLGIEKEQLYLISENTSLYSNPVLLASSEVCDILRKSF